MEKSQSEPWIGVTRFALLYENPLKGHVWVQGRLTKTNVRKKNQKCKRQTFTSSG